MLWVASIERMEEDINEWSLLPRANVRSWKACFRFVVFSGNFSVGGECVQLCVQFFCECPSVVFEEWSRLIFLFPSLSCVFLK